MIPRLRLFGATLDEGDGEAEGLTISLRWFGILVELTFARFTPYPPELRR